jgi:hypothetical protein
MKFDAQGRLVAPPVSLPHFGGPIDELGDGDLDEVTE